MAYSFVAPKEGGITFSACESDFDTYLYVTTWNFETRIVSNDDSTRCPNPPQLARDQFVNMHYMIPPARSYLEIPSASGGGVRYVLGEAGANDCGARNAVSRRQCLAAAVGAVPSGETIDLGKLHVEHKKNRPTGCSVQRRR